MKKNFWKKVVSVVVLAAMVITSVPMSAFADHRADGYPLDMNNDVILSVIIGDNFPGESNTHQNLGSYVSFNSSFQAPARYDTERVEYLNNKAGDLLKDEIRSAITEGTPAYLWGRECYVWGIFDTSASATSTGLAEYFVKGTADPIFDDANETKMIQAAWNKKNINKNKNPADYEIVWYVVKYQTSDSSWHIDGIIRPRTAYSVNYYGNGNTSGGAPVGAASLAVDSRYTILGNTGRGNDGNLVREEAGVKYTFLGWNTKADGTGTSYAPGDVVTLNENTAPGRTLSLYAQWQGDIKYKATAEVYLDGTLTDLADVHGGDVSLAITKDSGASYISLARTSKGIYEAEVAQNGNYALYHKHDGDYHRAGEYNIPIYNANGRMQMYHYSVNYHSNGGAMAKADAEYTEIGLARDVLNVINDVPDRNGYTFLGWNTKADGSGTSYAPGDALPALTGKVDLYAQWQDAVDVKVKVVIDHEDGKGAVDNSADKQTVSLDLVVRPDANSPYLEVKDGDLNLSAGNHAKHDLTETGDVSTYAPKGATFSDLTGGDSEYSVTVVSKDHYVVKSIDPQQDSNGDWEITVNLEFAPEYQNLTVGADIKDSVPTSLHPEAVITKITRWNGSEWEIISEQDGSAPGVRVSTPNKTGNTASYPVAATDADGYRMVVSAFVYPDGTIKAVDQLNVNGGTTWTDGFYTATLKDISEGKTFGTLKGAYFSDTAPVQNGSLQVQNGSLVVEIDANPYKVVLHSNHPNTTIMGDTTHAIEDLYKVPSLGSYVPQCSEDYHIFDGWYLDEACTTPAPAAGTILTTGNTDNERTLHLYAKIKEPLTIKGEVKIDGFYYLWDDEKTDIHPVDRATGATILLEEIGTLAGVRSANVSFTYDDTTKIATANYSFLVPDDGKEYEVMTRLNNYDAAYNNEPIDDNRYVVLNDLSDLESTVNDALFGGDSVADVNIHLTFNPESYLQDFIVDADAIGEGFRPSHANAVIYYRDLDDTHAPNIISQHHTGNNGTGGIAGALVEDCDNNGIFAELFRNEYIWKYHFDGSLYEYSLGVTELYGSVPGVFNNMGTFDRESAPYVLRQSESTAWSTAEGKVIGGYNNTGVLKLELIPKTYNVIFDANAGAATVGGMESLETIAVEMADGTLRNMRKIDHTWSYKTEIDVTLTRSGYNFLGWFQDANGNKEMDGDEAYVTFVDAAVREDTILTADWELIENTITYTAERGGSVSSASETISAESGEVVGSTATANAGYEFLGWYKGDQLVSESQTLKPEKVAAAYVAEFRLIEHTITYTAEEGGSVSHQRETVSVESDNTVGSTATAKPGYAFNGWYMNGVLVSSENYYQPPKQPGAYVAKFTPVDYVITYTDGVNDVEVFADQVTSNARYGDATPEFVGPADCREGYIFKGWNPNKKATVDGDMTYTATWELITNNIYYVADEGGTVSSASEIISAESGDVNGSTATPNAGYTFVGWYGADGTKLPDGATIVPNKVPATYTAKFAPIEYTVTWVNHDGNKLGEGKYHYNDTPAYSGATPQKADDAQYTYIHTGWTPEIVPVTQDATYTAVFTPVEQKYTVNWVDWDDELIEKDENVGYGTIPSFDSQNPVRPDDAGYSYEFIGWDAPIVEVSGDVTYKAVYKPTEKKVTINYVAETGGSVSSSSETLGVVTGAASGSVATPATGYAFDAWYNGSVKVGTAEEFVPQKNGDGIYEAATYTAKFTPINYVITYTDGVDDVVVFADQVTSNAHYGDATPEFQGSADRRPGYTFKGWTPAKKATVDGNMTYTATWEAIDYTVTWVNHDGTVLGVDTHHYGDTPEYLGAQPQKQEDEYFTYTFKGWTPGIVSVTEDAVYTAEFDAVGRTYTVTWLNWDGSVLETDTCVAAGSMPEYNGSVPTRAASASHTFTFKGWDKELTEVLRDVVYTATYDAYAVSIPQRPNPSTGVRP